jgi:2-oxoglutarate dehydrogenase E2 component (dihydrolipoamide succinyltransferase)
MGNQKMSDKVKLILVGVVSLLVGAAGGGGFGMMQVDEVTQKLAAVTQEKDAAVKNADRLRKMTDESTRKFGKDLAGLVTAAGAATDDPAKTVDATRALLAARDAIRASLDGVRASLDGDMDALAAELGNASPNADKIKFALESLKQSWPAKEQALEVATSKLLVDLGLLQAPPAPKPAAPATAPAAAAPAAPAAAAATPAPAAAPAPAAKK